MKNTAPLNQIKKKHLFFWFSIKYVQQKSRSLKGFLSGPSCCPSHGRHGVVSGTAVTLMGFLL